MVYTDGAHLVADSLDELYNYAHSMKLNLNWLDFSGKNVHPHFDICGQVRQRILADKNVQQVSKKEIVRLCRLNFRPPENEQEIKEWEEHHQQKISSLPMPSEDDYARMFKQIMKNAGL